MFRARKFVEVPSKRGGGLLSPPHPDLLIATGGTATTTAESKRQRLLLDATEAQSLPRYSQQQVTEVMDGDDESANVLIETPECTITMIDTLPSYISEEIRKEKLAHAVQSHNRQQSFPQIVACRASVPSARVSSGRQWIMYFVVILRTKILLWQEEQGRVIALSLPDELDDREVLHPFLFALYGQSLSLMVIGQSGIVLFWEDIDLPYESIPLSVQIPLQYDEHVYTNADAIMSTVDQQAPHLQQSADDEDLKSIVCWSNQGNIWEVAMEDRRIRVRSFEKRNGGFLSGLTKSVSQFFFASASRPSGGQFGGELDPNLPIKYVKVVPSVVEGDDSGLSGNDETSDMLVLFSNGIVERRTFSTGDVMDCSCVSVKHFDASRVAISYFSDNFPDHHLAKVDIVSLPYVLDNCFALLVAFVCSSRHESSAKVKYALFQFALGSTSESPEPEWACVLDYEPVFTEVGDHSRYFQVESFGIARGAFYLVWTKALPIQFSSILLPRSGQSTVRYAAFSLQGVHNRTAVAFGGRVEANAFAGDAVKGSVSFVLMEDDSKTSSGAGTVCVATASNMQKVDGLPTRTSTTASLEKSRKRLEEASRITGESPHFLGENLDVQEYVRLLLTHFHDDPYSTSPLRIGSKDAASVAHAAIAIDFQILDAKPSSGLRWGKQDTEERSAAAREQAAKQKNASDVGLVTPKLVRFQLEEKRARHVEFLDFLQRRCANVWQVIVKSPELSRYLIEDEEKLNAAISLSKFQGSLLSGQDESSATDAHRVQRRLTGQFLLHAIEKTVEQRGYQKEQLRLAGYNAFDIFYCEVSKITELFQLLSVEVHKLGTTIGESDPAYLSALLEAGYSMLSMLQPAINADSQKTPFVLTGSWAFTRNVREVILDHVSRLTVLVGYSTIAGNKQIRWQQDEIFEVAEQIKNLGRILLDGYLRFVPTVNGEEAEDLRKEAEQSTRHVLNPLVYVATNTSFDAVDGTLGGDLDHVGAIERKRNDLFAQCIKLSEKYSYYEGMVFLVYTEDQGSLSKFDYAMGKLSKTAATKRLESYCKAYEGFISFLLRWYGGEIRNPWPVSAAYAHKARSSMLAYMLANANMFGAQTHQYMSGHEELSRLRWVSSISIERYDLVATFALREAENEQGSLSKRKNLASIAKIAALAAPNTSRNEEAMQQIKRELVRSKIQEVLQQLPLDRTIDVRPLSSEDLVATCLDATSSVAKTDPLRVSLFLMTLEAVESLDAEPDASAFDDTLARVWRHCILDDEELWETLVTEYASSVNEQKLEQMMRKTLLYAAMKQYLSRRSHVAVPVALTVDLIDDLIEHEDNDDSILAVRSRQVLAKTLNLALTH
uniref:Nucleoporin Nup133/Nup155-like N-terminal domain-containing protein n=1 Tax=Globisporangium ultimum (strain ATCC 200006 / CBS 805.95 / DAOM BR144) TaxID=431595 RepID=K3WHJ8_GLOUD